MTTAYYQCTFCLVWVVKLWSKLWITNWNSLAIVISKVSPCKSTLAQRSIWYLQSESNSVPSKLTTVYFVGISASRNCSYNALLNVCYRKCGLLFRVETMSQNAEHLHRFYFTESIRWVLPVIPIKKCVSTLTFTMHLCPNLLNTNTELDIKYLHTI